VVRASHPLGFAILLFVSAAHAGKRVEHPSAKIYKQLQPSDVVTDEHGQVLDIRTRIEAITTVRPKSKSHVKPAFFRNTYYPDRGLLIVDHEYRNDAGKYVKRKPSLTERGNPLGGDVRMAAAKRLGIKHGSLKMLAVSDIVNEKSVLNLRELKKKGIPITVAVKDTQTFANMQTFARLVGTEIEKVDVTYGKWKLQKFETWRLSGFGKKQPHILKNDQIVQRHPRTERLLHYNLFLKLRPQR
jgi:hypothetical protein